MPRTALTIWERPERRGRGPAPSFSRGQLAAAALRIADKHGIASVTMRAVALEMGAGQASLYRYIENRDDLIDLMTDEAYADIDLTVAPDESPLRSLVGLAVETRRVLLRRPWLVDVLATITPVGPSVAAYLDRCLDVLSDFDLPAAYKLEVVAVLSGTVRLLVADELSQMRAGEERDLHRIAYLQRVARDGQFPHLAAALDSAGVEPPDSASQFARIVHRVLHGLLGGEDVSSTDRR